MIRRRKKSGKDLTEREIEILKMLLIGKLNKEIAEFFGLSINTIRSHNQNIFSKLGADNRSEAVFEYLKMTGGMQ